MRYFNCPMSSSLFSSFQENTKCESSFFADTCTRRVPIFNSLAVRGCFHSLKCRSRATVRPWDAKQGNFWSNRFCTRLLHVPLPREFEKENTHHKP